jgi:hypothetical protein
VTFGESDMIREVTFGESGLIREVTCGESSLIREVTFGESDLIRSKKKYMCDYDHMSKKSRVGRSALIFFFFILDIGKPRNSRSRLRNPIPVFHFQNFR